jgi:hypothetical protein
MVDYNLLPIENDDSSTDNLKRKFEKTLREYERNPTDAKQVKLDIMRSVLFPERVVRTRYVKRKKIYSQIYNLLKNINDKKLCKYFDNRIFEIYILFINIFPHEVCLKIIDNCEFYVNRRNMTVPRDIYIYCQKGCKDNNEKNELIIYYKNNKHMITLINSLFK